MTVEVDYDVRKWLIARFRPIVFVANHARNNSKYSILSEHSSRCKNNYFVHLNHSSLVFVLIGNIDFWLRAAVANKIFMPRSLVLEKYYSCKGFISHKAFRLAFAASADSFSEQFVMFKLS